MKLENLQRLKHLITRLTPDEISVLKKYLVAFDTRHGGYTPKTLLLLELLEGNDNVEVLLPGLCAELELKTQKALSMLGKRLREKIEETVVLDVTLNSEGNLLSPPYIAQAEIGKKKLAALSFRGRGMYDEALRIINRLIRLAKKYELLSELVDLYYSKQNINGLMFGQKGRREVLPEIEKYESFLKHYNIVRNKYFDAIDNYGFNGVSTYINNRDKLLQLKEICKEVRDSYEFTNIKEIGFYAYSLYTEYYQQIGEFKMAAKQLVEVLELTRAPSFKQAHKGIVYLNISQNDIYRHAYAEAIYHAKMAMRFFSSTSGNKFIAVELQAFALCYSLDINECGAVLKKTMNNIPRLKQVRTGKWNYLIASIAFFQKAYTKVHIQIGAAAPLNHDKKGWQLGIRFLQILTFIEQEKHDLADNHILNLKEFIARTLRGKARQRDKVIAKVLWELRKRSYSFEDVANQKQSLLQQLRSNEPELCWQVLTPEIVIFHQWFDAKLAGIPFVPDYGGKD